MPEPSEPLPPVEPPVEPPDSPPVEPPDESDGESDVGEPELDVTTTLIIAVLLPSSVVKVMIAFPSLLAATNPLSSTAATLGLLEENLTFWLVALLGSTEY